MARFSWLAVFFTVLVWSAWYPKDMFVWFLEVFPALAGFVVLLMTRYAFPLTPLLYTLILLHMIVLMVGGHYTYAEVPLFDQVSEWMGWQRNNYDKLGHFMQGFVPVMVAREIVLRKGVILFPMWRNFFLLCFCLALSAFYELVEWWVALASGTGAEAFLGTQGYVWDTQSDMAFALCGAVLGLLCLSRRHDKQLALL